MEETKIESFKNEEALKKFNDPEEIKKRIAFYSDFDPINNPKGCIVDIGYGKVKVEVSGFPWMVRVKKKKRKSYLYKNYFILNTLNMGKDNLFHLPNSYYVLTNDPNDDKYLLVNISDLSKDFKVIQKNVKLMTTNSLDNAIDYVLPQEEE